MKRNSLLKHFIFLATAMVFLLPTISGLADSNDESQTKDRYGYTVDLTGSYQWVEASEGGQVVLKNTSDSFTGPIDIGFDFPFYENSYSQLFISSNGLISFGAGSSSYANKSLPKVGIPDNFLAVFWDDLSVGTVDSTGVFYKAGEVSGQKYFAVEWKDVFQARSTSELLTFEAVLYANGNVCYQYQKIANAADTATVGIEDSHGVDGLTYLADAPGLDGLQGTQSLCFNRPANQAQVKALPLYQSSFVENTPVVYEIEVLNIGKAGSDTFNFSYTSTGAAWTVSLFEPDGITPLSDSNGDQKLDTGSVVEGGSTKVIVKIQPSAKTSSGDYQKLLFDVSSSLNPTKTMQVTIQSALAAPFAQVYADVQSLRLALTQPGKTKNLEISDSFSGSNLSLAKSNSGTYLYTWERNGFNHTNWYSDIEYVVINSAGQITRPLGKLTDNAAAASAIQDHYPSTAILPNEKMAVAWIRKVLNSSNEINSNVFLAFLDATGAPLGDPLNLTNNTGWRGQENKNVPEYFSPYLSVSANNRLVVAWEERRTEDLGDGTTRESSDISIEILGSDGQVLKPVTYIARSQSSGFQYNDPLVANLGSNNFLITYAIFNPAAQTDILAYLVINSAGDVIFPETTINNSQMDMADAVQLPNGKIVLGWINANTGNISYVVLNGATFGIEREQVILDNPFGRRAGNMSITADMFGRAVITWLDIEMRDYLYYALLSMDGVVATPPMIFYQGDGSTTTIQTAAGDGSAFYIPGLAYLPFTSR